LKDDSNGAKLILTPSKGNNESKGGVIRGSAIDRSAKEAGHFSKSLNGRVVGKVWQHRESHDQPRKEESSRLTYLLVEGTGIRRRVACQTTAKEESPASLPASPLPPCISIVNQGGQTDIAAVEIAHAAADASAPSWRSMVRVRRRGAVTWCTSRAPVGPLQLRLVVTAGVGGKWLLFFTDR
jgi:hypothetical protein